MIGAWVRPFSIYGNGGYPVVKALALLLQLQFSAGEVSDLVFFSVGGLLALFSGDFAWELL